MSWIEKIQTKLKIQTGDGQTYEPQWLNAAKNIEYNVSEFEFPNVGGTLAFRTTPKGARYSLELYFQGENHLDVASNFEISARDSRAWTLTHPFYGRLLVQPLSLQIDNTQYNVSKVTVPVIETITDVFPKGSKDALSAIKSNSASTNQAQAQNFALITPTPTTVNYLNLDVLRAYRNMAKFAIDDIANSVANQFNTSLGLITDAASEPFEAIEATQGLLMMPASFALSAKQRLLILKTQYDNQKLSYVNIVKREEKVTYETLVGTTLAAFSLTAGTPLEGDFEYRIDAVNAAELVLDSWNTYINDLGLLQTQNNNSPTSYIPEYNSLTQLSQLVNFAISNLLNIALNGKQERSFELEDNSNWLILTHRLYGIDEANLNVEKLIQNNNGGLSEMLEVKKGRIIKYYV